jgi:hypothetical protein
MAVFRQDGLPQREIQRHAAGHRLSKQEDDHNLIGPIGISSTYAAAA